MHLCPTHRTHLRSTLEQPTIAKYSTLNQIIPLFPLSHGLFPDGKLHLQIFEVRYLNLIKQCHQQQLPFGVVQLINDNQEVQVPGKVPALHQVGCLAHIREFDQVQPAFFRVVCQGGLRFQLTDLQPGPYGVWQGAVTYLPQDPELAVPSELQILADKLGKVIASLQSRGSSTSCLFLPLIIWTSVVGWPIAMQRLCQSARSSSSSSSKNQTR